MLQWPSWSRSLLWNNFRSHNHHWLYAEPSFFIISKWIYYYIHIFFLLTTGDSWTRTMCAYGLGLWIILTETYVVMFSSQIFILVPTRNWCSCSFTPDCSIKLSMSNQIGSTILAVHTCKFPSGAAFTKDHCIFYFYFKCKFCFNLLMTSANCPSFCCACNYTPSNLHV